MSYNGDALARKLAPAIGDQNADSAWPLNAYEMWCVRSNLRRIEEKNLDRAGVVALLRANGYPRVALAVEQAPIQIDSSGSEDS